jgi:hypothetical protein
LRAIRALPDAALKNMSARFDAMYAKTGRPSIPPEKLLRAQLIQMLYSVRSEQPVWDVTVLTKNRDRLLERDVAREFLCEVVKQAQSKGRFSAACSWAPLSGVRIATAAVHCCIPLPVTRLWRVSGIPRTLRVSNLE